MVDGEVAGLPEAEMTPEQRVDAGIADARFGQAGGRGGQFVFADLAELDSVTAQWKSERDRILEDGRTLRRAIERCNPPAPDMMSGYQADALKTSLNTALDHNNAMFNYADGYVQKLEASRASMAGTERDNTAKLRTTGED